MDGSMVPPEWHRRLHCRTDSPLPTKPHVYKFTRANSKFNLSSSPKEDARILPLVRKVNKGSHLLHFISKDRRPASAQTIHNNGTTLLLQARNAFVSPPIARWSYLSHRIWTPVVCIIYRTLWKLCLRIPGPGHSKSRRFYTTVLEHSFEVWSYQVLFCWHQSSQTCLPSNHDCQGQHGGNCFEPSMPAHLLCLKCKIISV